LVDTGLRHRQRRYTDAPIVSRDIIGDPARRGTYGVRRRDRSDGRPGWGPTTLGRRPQTGGRWVV